MPQRIAPALAGPMPARSRACSRMCSYRSRSIADWGSGRDVPASAAFFLTSGQHPFDGPRVNRYAQLRLDQLGQLGIVQIGLAGPLPIQKLQYRSRQLVGSMGTGLLRNQSSQTILLDGCLGLIERGPRESGFVRRQADGGLFG